MTAIVLVSMLVAAGVAFVGIIAFSFFGERPDAATIAGTALILVAGLYTLLRQARPRPKPLRW